MIPNLPLIPLIPLLPFILILGLALQALRPCTFAPLDNKFQLTKRFTSIDNWTKLILAHLLEADPSSITFFFRGIRILWILQIESNLLDNLFFIVFGSFSCICLSFPCLAAQNWTCCFWWWLGLLTFGQKLSTVPLGEIGCLGLFVGWFWLVGWGDIAVYVFYPLRAEKWVYYSM